MKTSTRSTGLLIASAATAVTLGLTTAATAGAANIALMLNGIAGGTQLPDLVMANVLGGMFGDYNRQNVPWPQQARPVTGPDSLTLSDSVDQGASNLDTKLASSLAQLGAGEHVTLVGLSAGALVVDQELRKLASAPNAPAKEQLQIVVVSDSSRMGFNKNRYDGIVKYQYRPPVDTIYDTTVVAAEYDGFADFPDRPWNLVAVANAFAGEVVSHVPNMLTSLSTVPKSNITVTTNPLGGVTTNYLIPADHLPLVKLIPALANQEAQLRKVVEAAYIRNDGKSTGAAQPLATSTAAAPAATAVPVAAAIAAPEPTVRKAPSPNRRVTRPAPTASKPAAARAETPNSGS